MVVEGKGESTGVAYVRRTQMLDTASSSKLQKGHCTEPIMLSNAVGVFVITYLGKSKKMLHNSNEREEWRKKKV